MRVVMRRLWFFMGTTAELIKLYPVLDAARERGVPWCAVASGQSPKGLVDQWRDFGMPAEELRFLVENDEDLRTSRQAATWFARAAAVAGPGLARRLRERTGRTPE